MRYAVLREGGVLREDGSVITPRQTEDWLAYLKDLENGAELMPPEVTPEAPRSVPDLIAARMAEVEAIAGGLRGRATLGATAAEMAAWGVKAAEARAYATSGSPADAPLLALEAQARGIALAAMVSIVSAKASALARLEALIAGTSGKHRDALAKLTSSEDVASYDLNADWPAA